MFHHRWACNFDNGMWSDCIESMLEQYSFEPWVLILTAVSQTRMAETIEGQKNICQGRA